MAKVIVFQENGEIRLGTLIDSYKRVNNENLMDVIPCPQELLDSIPKRVVDLCKKSAPIFLYMDSINNWERK